MSVCRCYVVVSAWVGRSDDCAAAPWLRFSRLGEQAPTVDSRDDGKGPEKDIKDTSGALSFHPLLTRDTVLR